MSASAISVAFHSTAKSRPSRGSGTTVFAFLGALRCRAVDHVLGARSSADSGPGDGVNSDPGAPCARGDARSR
jgi:hypothetical protein